MPSPFQPSVLARIQTTVLDRGNIDQPVTQIALGRQEPDPRNPLFKTTAEEPSSVAPFLKANMAKPLPDPRDYEVLPGGRVVYKTPEAMAKRQQPQMTASTEGRPGGHPWRGGLQRTSTSVMAVPPKGAFLGHNSPVNLNFKR